VTKQKRIGYRLLSIEESSAKKREKQGGDLRHLLGKIYSSRQTKKKQKRKTGVGKQ